MATRPERLVVGLTLSAIVGLTLAAGAGASGDSASAPPAPISTEDPAPSTADPAPAPGPGSEDPPPAPTFTYAPTCRLVGAGEPQPVVAPVVTAGSAGTFTVAPALPPGLSIDGASGAITGVPTAPETGVARIVSSGSGEAGLALTIIGASLAYPASLLSPVAGRPITPIVPTVTIAPAGQATATFSATGLPEGLAIDAATGAITGRLSEGSGPAAVEVTMTVVAGDGTACGTLVQPLEINPPEIAAPPGAACPTRPKRIYVPLASTRETPQQMFTNLEHARAAVTKMNALRRWLDAGIIPRRDLCNHTIGARDIDPAVPLVRSTRRDASANWTTRPVTGFGYALTIRGRRPLSEESFAAVEARVRAAELRFMAIRAELARGVAGADFAERMPAKAKLALGLYAPPVTGTPTSPAAPAPAGGPDPADLCATNGTTLARLNCQHLRAVRMIHLSNVIRQALLNRVHGEPAQYDLAQSTTARRGFASSRLRTACNAQFPSALCRSVLGAPAAEGNAAIDRWLTGLRNYEVRYLGGAMRHFGIADGSIGSAQIVPNSPPAS